MTASRVTPPTDEGVDVDGMEEVGGVTVSVRGRFGQSWASLLLTVASSMAYIVEKCVDSK